jgi:transcription elongation factor GreB
VSKAFTKEDGPGEAPIVPRRAPLPAGVPNYVTSRGLAALRDELARFDAAAPTAGVGDARAQAPRRAELEQRIATAVVTPPPADRGQIRFGARVGLTAPGGRQREIQIVGVDEANPAHDLVAFIAPLARALLGRRAGETVTVPAPGGEEDLEIRSVTYD